MFLRKLGKRGVAMTEYAILLAFVAAIGGSFASDNAFCAIYISAIFVFLAISFIAFLYSSFVL